MTHICERPYSKRFLIGQETLKDAVVHPISKVTINIFKNQLDKLWEQDGIIYDPDVDIDL